MQLIIMKKILVTTLLALAVLYANAQTWSPAGEKIKTQWAKDLDVQKIWQEYPRPALERSQWLNLNGLWDYTILPKGSPVPSTFQGKILVPFAIESSLSGVQKNVGAENELWYHHTFQVPKDWKAKTILLNFGAVDWRADVWINGLLIGSHKGGYTAFSFDITPYLVQGQSQDIVVRVWDPSSEGFQPHGKQVTHPGGIWYTSVTGIWQTVWLEAVNNAYVTSLKILPNIDAASVSLTPDCLGTQQGDLVILKVLDKDKVVATGKGLPGFEILLAMPNAKLWSPEDPFLYDVEVSIIRNSKPIDFAKSYFGMRKISTKADKHGTMRMQLNNKDYFQFGLLDQGWWPDGLYTAPSDEALKFDIVKTKELGYNLIRKHVKVEPARWYYHADRLGILVWQDMPSGDQGPEWQMESYFNGREAERTPESEENFKAEWKAIINMLVSNPCVVVWVPFNEAWGQFKTSEIAQWTKSYDPSRLVNPASGGNYYPVGDMLDVHNYPDPKLKMYDPSRVCVLGEYGGIGLAINGHLWHSERNWGYVQYKTSKEATDAYVAYAEKLKDLVNKGFSAAIYTQTTDVEGEVNGIMTYDRALIKLDAERIRKINIEVCKSLEQNHDE